MKTLFAPAKSYCNEQTIIYSGARDGNTETASSILNVRSGTLSL